MTTTPDVHDVRLLSYHPASGRERAQGLLGWLQVEVGGLVVVEGVALRRTRAGSLRLSFPSRVDSRGRRRSLVRPVDEGARLAIEAAVLLQIELQGGGAAIAPAGPASHARDPRRGCATTNRTATPPATASRSTTNRTARASHA